MMIAQEKQESREKRKGEREIIIVTDTQRNGMNEQPHILGLHAMYKGGTPECASTTRY